MTLSISDPMGTEKSELTRFEQTSDRFINDRRDLPFIRLTLLVIATVIPSAIFLFFNPDFNWILGLVYLGWVMGHLFAPVTLMLHNTSHRPLFKSQYYYLNFFIPWAIIPFFGQPPESYFAHHVGMHHTEGNLPEDLSSTMRYQRDSLFDFLRYLTSFLFTANVKLLHYFWKRKSKRFVRKVWISELGYFSLMGLLYSVNARATWVVLILPVLLSRFGMMAGNWAQHAFLDPTDPGNPYRNSITCINTLYNRHCFNDGYHIGHHVRPTRHWTEMPADFLKNKDRYIRESSIVFQGIDYFGIWTLLMLKAYRRLARHFVQLENLSLTETEVIQLLRSRTQKIQNT